MKFLCDQMLARLGRWLRAAGYDTEIIETAEEDRTILQKAISENRLLLTRDKHFLEMKSNQIIYFPGNSLNECILELNKKIEIDWQYRPFSRCLLCNTLLVQPTEQLILEQVPEDVRSQSEHFWFCEKCKKVYWEGSHTKRMRQQLQSWQVNR